MSDSSGWSRRAFLRASAAAGGGLVVTFVLPGCRPGPRGEAAEVWLNAWLSVNDRGQVTITAPVPEIGQGARTAIAMIVAGELGADWATITIVQADADDTFGPGQRAAGSGAIRDYWEPARMAAARVRTAIVAAAAERWGIEPEDCFARDGRVHEEGRRRSIGFGALAARAAELVPDPDMAVVPRPVDDLDRVGEWTRGADVPRIVTGEVIFGIDEAQPGMRYASIVRCPVYGGTVRRLDAAAALAVPGVLHVVKMPAVGQAERPSVAEGVAVVAESTWAALQGRAALEVEWDEGANASESTERLHHVCAELIGRPARRIHDVGDVDRAFRDAARGGGDVSSAIPGTRTARAAQLSGPRARG